MKRKRINIQHDLESRRRISQKISTRFDNLPIIEPAVIERDAESEVVQEPPIDEITETDPKLKKGKRAAKGNL